MRPPMKNVDIVVCVEGNPRGLAKIPALGQCRPLRDNPVVQFGPFGLGPSLTTGKQEQAKDCDAKNSKCHSSLQRRFSPGWRAKGRGAGKQRGRGNSPPGLPPLCSSAPLPL